MRLEVFIKQIKTDSIMPIIQAANIFSEDDENLDDPILNAATITKYRSLKNETLKVRAEKSKIHNWGIFAKCFIPSNDMVHFFIWIYIIYF